MPDISITKPHQLSHDDARAAAQKVADKMVEKFDMTIAWEGDMLSFNRSGVSGTLTVYPTEATIEVVLGAFFKFFAPKLEEQISNQMNQVFAS